MTAWLDRILGRVTMYALVIICLGVIAVVAEVYVLVGLLPQYQPFAIPVTAAVLLISSYLANSLAGVIFKVRPQLSSTTITALLLLFIFNPSLDPGVLALLAAVAAFAVVTKYLLAVRGRHIFNPAGAAALIAVIVFYFVPNAPFVTWWVGTGILLPFVAVGALAVLFRTRRLPLAGVFVGVAILVFGLVYVINGSSFIDGVSYAVLTSPAVFFAGFMLSEPLTLAPRRRQQLIVAAIVGVLFGTLLTALVNLAMPSDVLGESPVAGLIVGTVLPSPQFALIVGNLISFFYGQRRGIRLDYVGKNQLAPTSWEFEFAPQAPVKFVPGQYMELTLPHPRTDARGWRRVFSIASAPGDGSRIRFGIRLPEESSSFKRALLGLAPGTKVTATSVSGDFVLPADPTTPLLLVAGGIGITPYVSQLEQIRDSNQKRDIALVYAVSSSDDLSYADDIAKTAGCAVTVVSREKPSAMPKGWKWVEADRMSGEFVLTAVPDAATRDVFLSGPPELVGDLRKALHTGGVKRIHTDVFIGY